MLTACRSRIVSSVKPTATSLTRVRRLTTNLLDDDKVQLYQTDGAVCLRGVFDKKWLDLVTEGISKNLKQPSAYCDWLVEEDGDAIFFNDYFNYKKIPEYLEYVTSSPAAEIAGKLMKASRSVFFHEHVFFKSNGSSRETPFHHDFTYYPLDGFQNCSIWMPTTKVRKQSAVRFIKGSHRWAHCFIPVKFASHQNYTSDGDLFEGFSDISEYMRGVKDEDILQWELEPGDCIAFHMKCVHGTESSSNPVDRTVMVTRWLGDDMTYAQRPWVASPPADLLPLDLKIGDTLKENEDFLVPWKL